ncbi:protein IDA-LIKE 2 [Nymphaea colorata]|uniref:protein IDA-LIKE 2 n=1 Tax=Nymphaea colorata TaxID=210225 RepID=UPI00129EEED5|nr:protein IDA-LIKE 2 [Nymphaea colorata]
MGNDKNAILLVLLLGFLVCCHGSRPMQSFSAKPKSGRVGSFLGYLPKATPIPPSGPSRQHNGVGLQSRSSP